MISRMISGGSEQLITLRNKIGQMLVMGFHGSEINDNSPITQWLTNDGLGGVILFDKDLTTDTYGKNLQNQPQIKCLTHKLNHYANKTSVDGKRLPLLIAIDYEGGAVDRLTKIDGCMTTLKARELTRLVKEELEEELIQMALTLKTLGFNLNFAPVVDLDLNHNYGIIGKLDRCFSADPAVVTQMARQFVNVFNRYGIACCYKHFPGHGSALGDTHEGFVDVSETYQQEELTPYRHLIQDNNKPVMVMTAHVINKHLDAKGLPATLSHEILTGTLRQSMGYDGVVISDDLQMQAIAHHFELENALCMTINAGADMVIFANQLGYITAPQVIDTIEHLVLNKKIEQQRIDDAYCRIIRLKQK